MKRTLRCVWAYDGPYWQTQCRNAFQFEIEAETPILARFGWCPYCGGRLVEVDEDGTRRQHEREAP